MSKVEEDAKFEALLDHIKRCRGFDFTGYKRPSLMRRVRKRLSDVGALDFSDYIDYLEVHPQEFDLLFNTILINVTSFFRDKQSWDHLNKVIIPRIAEGGDQIRVWSAGCATGQEAYTIAMLLCEALGERALIERVKIYATDVDEEALLFARQAAYDSRMLDGIPPNLRERYFIRSGITEVFRSELRRLIIFGRHDLVQDAPIPKLDLLICRNTLMYLNADTQSRILARLHFALKPHGYLFLGRAEMLLGHTNLFEPHDLQNRIFTKVVGHNLRECLLVLAQANDEMHLQIAENALIKEASFEKSQLAQIIIDSAGALTAVNARARDMFEVGVSDVGKNFKDLPLSYRPLELRSIIEGCMTERLPVVIDKVMYPGKFGVVEYLSVRVTPLFNAGDKVHSVSVTFDNVTAFNALCDDLRTAHEELETTYEELESTNEELETTNEELESTNEELETTNEELQSTNEELETTNAELQATNEELESTNDGLRNLTVEVEKNIFILQNVLSSLKHGIAVLDKQGSVRIWNKQCEEFWGLRSDEVIGKSLVSLDIGLPAEQINLQGTGGHTSDEAQRVILDSVNRRGRKFKCAVTVNRLVGRQQDAGTILFFDEAH